MCLPRDMRDGEWSGVVQIIFLDISHEQRGANRRLISIDHIQTVAQTIPHIAWSIARGIFYMYCCIFSLFLYRVYTVYAVFAVLWRCFVICTGGCSKCSIIVYHGILYRASYTLPYVYSLIMIVILIDIYQMWGDRRTRDVSPLPVYSIETLILVAISRIIVGTMKS